MILKKITWLTADYFIDCDIDIISELKDEYNIEWHIVLPNTNSRFTQDNIQNRDSLNGVKMHFWFEKYRKRDISNILFYWKLLTNMKKQKSDFFYINIQGFPYFAILGFLLLNRKSTIMAVHQAQVHEGMKFKFITKAYFKFLYSWFENFHLFSNTQAEIFHSKYPKKNINIIPLALKDFGHSTVYPSNVEIVFLNFGTIIKNKNIGLLIKAACNIYEKGYRNFKIKLVGACRNWNQYKELIIYPQIFETNIHAIKNNEIPDLFKSAHYLVLPYSSVSQSGPLKIAFNYNIPVIASNLKEFKNEIKDGETGFLFENNNVKDLERVLITAIQNHSVLYEKMKTAQQVDVKNRYSKQNILNAYRKIF